MAAPLPNVWRVDHEPSSYLGFGLDMSQATVRVSTPDGRPLGRVRTLSAARALVKAYRKPLENTNAPERMDLGGSRALRS